MLSKNNIKYINSLRVKKHRNVECLFIAEGEKLVGEILSSSFRIKAIYCTHSIVNFKMLNLEACEITPNEMKKISGLKSPSNVLALVGIPEYAITKIDFSNSLTLALDGIQDPGNLGTIIRLADWFGIDCILCSDDTADAYSPKVIQSCMGAISRVKVNYCNLPDVLGNLQKEINIPIYGTFKEGSNIYDQSLSPNGVIVMGNEGNGISPNVERLIFNRIHIPAFANNRTTVESLNVAMATAIVCSEFRRRHKQ